MSVVTLFSAKAGRAERMLKRQYDNPLFGEMKIESFDIQDARKQDAAEVETFVNYFRELVQQVIDLRPNADSADILKLKETLDKAYEISSGLAGDQAEMREMIQRLLGLMMQGMWKAVGNDAQGIEKLEMEEAARKAHFSLLEYPFIADMLAPESPVSEALLVPSLLSENAQTVALAFALFEPEQQQQIYQQAAALLVRLESTAASTHPRVQQAQLRLQEMAAILPPVNQRPS
jgi:hypothetical protein